MKKLYLAVILFCFAWQTYSQSFVEIGNGTASSSFPYTSWNYSWAKALYKSAQLNGSKTIVKFAVNYTSTTSKTLNNQKIYMKCVEATSLTADYENPTSSGYTLVFEGNLTFSQTGWHEIQLTTNFEYDGTKSLVVLWENRTGSSPYAGFSATETTESVIKVVGSDTAFPTANGWDPYPKALPNVRFYYEAGAAPETPQNEIPTSNSKKVNVDTNLSIQIGGNTTSYDVYFSTNESLVLTMDESVKIASDVEVTEPGIATIVPPSMPLQSKTTYYWKVLAKNATHQTESPVFNFQTQRVISEMPYTQDFEDTEIWTPGWYGDLTLTDWYYQSTPINWNKSSEANAYSGLSSAVCNPSGTGGDYVLVTPRINLPANHYVSFWWRNNSTIVGKVEGADATYVEVSTDGGNSWAELGVLSPATPNEWTWNFFDLSSYESSNLYLRWRYYRPEGQSGYPIFIDDIVIDELSDGGEITLSSSSIDFSNLAITGSMEKSVTITNTGTGFLNITNVSVEAPFSCSFAAMLAPSESAQVVVTYSPTAVGAASELLTFNVEGDFTGNNTIDLSGNAVALVPNFFQPFDASLSLPSGWSALNNPNHEFTSVAIKADSWAYSTPNVAKFVMFSEHNYPVTLVTPGLSNFDTHQLKFYAKRGGDYDVSVIVGYMANPYDVSSFVVIQTVALTSEYQQYTISFEPLEGYPYVGIRHGGNPETSSVTSIWVDDVSWNTAAGTAPNAAQVSKPLNGATNVDIMVNLKMQWINGGGEPTGYKLYMGESDTDFSIINGQVFEGSSNTSYTYTGALNFATTYFWKVVPYNANGDAVDCPVWSFTTMPNPTITTLPWSENFDAVVTGPGSNYPLGWTVENTNNDGPTWDAVNNNATPELAHSAPNAMNIIFSFYDMNDWLITPPLELEAGQSYKLKFWFRTMGDQIVPNPVERLSVYLGTSNLSTSMQTTAIYQNLNLNNLEWLEANVNFNVATNGVYFVGFHGHSEDFQGYLLIDDVSVDFNTGITSGESISGALSLYPNPASNQVNIAIEDNNNLPYNVRVVNATGQVILEKTMANGSISLNGIASGVYFVVAETAKGRYVGRLVVK